MHQMVPWVPKSTFPNVELDRKKQLNHRVWVVNTCGERPHASEWESCDSWAWAWRRIVNHLRWIRYIELVHEAENTIKHHIGGLVVSPSHQPRGITMTIWQFLT